MCKEEILRRAEKDVIKATENLKHANEKPNKSAVEIKNIEMKLEYAKFVYEAIKACVDIVS